MTAGPGKELPARRDELVLRLFRERPALLETVLYNWLKVEQRYTRYSGAQPYVPSMAAQDAADNVFLLKDEEGCAALAVVLAVVFGIDEEARQAWPINLWTLCKRLRCKKAWLLVFADDDRVADWASEPLTTGPHSFSPIVLRPRQVPEAAKIEEPAARFLAALLHMEEFSDLCGLPENLRYAEQALSKLGSPHAAAYRDMLARPLFAITARVLEVTAELWREDQRKLLAQILAERFGDAVTDELRARIAVSSPEEIERVRDTFLQGIGAGKLTPENVFELLRHGSSVQLQPLSPEQVEWTLAKRRPYKADFAPAVSILWQRRAALVQLVRRQLELCDAALTADLADRLLIASEAELFELGVGLMTQPPGKLLDALQRCEVSPRLLQIGEDFLASVPRLSELANPIGNLLEKHLARTAIQVKLVRRQLEARFGPLPAELAIPTRYNRLEILAAGERVIHAASLAEAISWDDDDDDDDDYDYDYDYDYDDDDDDDVEDEAPDEDT